MMTSHVLTLLYCCLSPAGLTGQYAHLLLANEVTNEVPVTPQSTANITVLLTDLGQAELKHLREIMHSCTFFYTCELFLTFSEFH